MAAAGIAAGVNLVGLVAHQGIMLFNFANFNNLGLIPHKMKFYTVKTKPYIKLRIIATLIDYTIFFALYYALLYTLGEDQGNGNYVLYGWPVLIIPICWTIYFVVTEASNQATPGHDICKLKVFKTNGQKPDFMDSFKRRICDPLDIFIYGLPALICIIKTPKNQRLGDLFADTVVVKPSDVEMKEVEF